MTTDLEGRRVYVSGTSKGIGYHIARECLERGARVTGTSWRTPPEFVEKQFADVKRYSHLHHDAGAIALTEKHLDNVVSSLGGTPDFVVFNAAEIPVVSPFNTTVTGKDVGDAYQHAFAVNVSGPRAFVQEEVRRWGPQHKVVNVFFSTIGELFYETFQTGPQAPGVPSMGPYIETKAADSSMATQLRLEAGLMHAVAGFDGLRVLLVKPQLVVTELGGVVCKTFRKTPDELGTLTPSQKAHQPKDVAHEVVERMIETYNQPPGASWGDPHIPRLPR